MAGFESCWSYWKFKDEVARRRRYIRTPVADEFLRAVAATCDQRAKTLRAGCIFWRAQLGHDVRPLADGEPEAPHRSARMKPEAGRAFEGRVNPKGIPCLYLATERDTAMSEVRPWIGSYVSVAQFRIVRELRVVDCSVNDSRSSIERFDKRVFGELSADGWTSEVWSDIGRAFTEPTTRSDDTADYAATQVLAELFRDRGYDGVVYKSAFGEEGFNIALFNIEDAELLCCSLYEAKAACYCFEETGRRYFVKTDT